MSSTDIHKYSAAHFQEHGYCSTSYNWGPETDENQPVYSTFTQSQEDLAHSANLYREQPESSVRQSQERGHVRSYSAVESTSYCSTRKKLRIAKRIASQTRNLDGLKRSSSTITSPNPQRLPMHKTTSPLSLSSHNISSARASSSSYIPSTSSRVSPSHSKSSKSSNDKTSSGYKKSNFDKEQTAVLNRWLELNLQHPYPTDEEKVSLAESAGITLHQVNNYYTNARRRDNYKRMCIQQGIIPIPKKRKKSERSSNSSEGGKENRIQGRGRSDSGLSSGGSRPASVQSSSSSASSSPKLVREGRDQVFVVDSGISHVQVPVFVKGLGFVPPPPLPSDVSPEVLAVSREKVDPVYVDVPADGSMFNILLSIAEKFHDADVKAYEKNLPRENYIAEELMAENPNAVVHIQNRGCDY